VGATPGELEAVLKLIQRFDPPGIAARDLRECLLIQLEQRGARPRQSNLASHQLDLAFVIVQDHYPLFIERRTGALAKTLRIPRQTVEEACALIRGLNPRPARGFFSEIAPTLVPDLVIRRRERHFDVELNDGEVPHLRVSRAYYRMLRDPNTPPDAKEFLLQRFRQAGWLIRAIDERNTTLLSVAKCLLSLQREFVEHGPQAIKPLTQAQVAKLIGRHPSTVSRAICGKTIDTPYGVLPLEELFASSVPQPPGTEGVSADGVSDAKIKSQIARLVEREDPQRPMSDDALAKQMAQEGITVARRTVAKYRASLKLLPAHLRKRQ
jgi:RNA polymerase sigma-54 factor